MQTSLRALFRKAQEAKQAPPAAEEAEGVAARASRGDAGEIAGPEEVDGASPAPLPVPSLATAATSEPGDVSGLREKRRLAAGLRVVQTFKRRKPTAQAGNVDTTLAAPAAGTSAPPRGGSAADPSMQLDAAEQQPESACRARGVARPPAPVAGAKQAPRFKQLYLDLGQTGFFHSRCPECGLCYARGLPSEDSLHAAHHASYLAGVAFKGWQGEHVVWSGADGARIVSVAPSDPPSRVSKMREVGEVMEKALGLQPGWLFSSPPEARSRLLLYVVGKRVRGALLAEHIASAFRAVPRHATAGGGAAAPPRETQRARAAEEAGPWAPRGEPEEALDGPADDEVSTGCPPQRDPDSVHENERQPVRGGRGRCREGAADGDMDARPGPPPVLGAEQVEAAGGDGPPSAADVPSNRGEDEGCSARQPRRPGDSQESGSCSWGSGGAEVGSAPRAADAAGTTASGDNAGALPRAGETAGGGGAGPRCYIGGGGGGGGGGEVQSGLRGSPPGGAAPQRRTDAPCPSSSGSGDFEGSSRRRKRAGKSTAGVGAGDLVAAAAGLAAGAAAVPPQENARGGAGWGAASQEAIPEALERETEPVPAELGVRAIWVHPTVRRSGVARRLLNAARACAAPGYVVPLEAMAFTQPTEMGAALAERYTGSARFLVYG